MGAYYDENPQEMLFETELKKHPGGRPAGRCYGGAGINKRLKRYFEAGKDGMEWYDHTYRNIMEIFNGDIDRTKMFISLLAATSPRADIKSNVMMAVAAMKMYDARLPFSIFAKRFMASHVPNIKRALMGHPLSGPKVSSFALALNGDPDAVTVDRWMMRAFHMDSDSPTIGEYRCIQKAVRRMAAQEGVEPRQYQAAVWVGIKRLEGDPADVADPFEVILDRMMRSGQSEIDFGAADAAEDEFRQFERSMGNNPSVDDDLDDGGGEFVFDPR